MGELLSIIAIVGLLALVVVVSVSRQRAGMTQAKARGGPTDRGRSRTSSADRSMRPPGRGKNGTAGPGRLTAGPVISHLAQAPVLDVIDEPAHHLVRDERAVLDASIDSRTLSSKVCELLGAPNPALLAPVASRSCALNSLVGEREPSRTWCGG